MPKEVEKRLLGVAAKMMKSGKLSKKPGESGAAAKKRYAYSTMTNMQKKGQIPAWRKLKARKG